jgi:transposase
MVAHLFRRTGVVALLESLTGAAPSVGFVHGLLERTTEALSGVHDRIRALITLAYAVCCNETPLRVGPKTPKVGKKRAEGYLLVACPELYTHYLLGDRSLDTLKALVLAERAAAGAVVVQDRYANYDTVEFTGLVHQLRAAHLLRDLDGAEVCPSGAVLAGRRPETFCCTLAGRRSRSTWLEVGGTARW